MKYACVIVASLFLGVVPARAQQGGLPVTQSQVNALQAQIDSLQGSLLALQKRVDNLSSTVVKDDGTADALVGTWNGSANTIQFRRAVIGGSQFEQFFFVSPAGGQQGPMASFSVVQPNNLPMTVGVNPEMWLARSDGQVPVTVTIKRNGMALEGTGTASPSGEPVISFNLFGVVLSNNFFLLKLRVPVPGNCAVNGVMILQGTGSLNPTTRTGMTFTGSALEGDCSHMVFRLGLTKQ